MIIFKNSWFTRFARKEKISDEALRKAVQRAENSQVDADLGGGVIKQRIATARSRKIERLPDDYSAMQR